MSDRKAADSIARSEFLQDANENKKIAANQRAFCIHLAERFDSDAPLTLEPHERTWVAGALRFFATIISDQPKKKKVPAPKFDAASEAVVYAVARMAGRRHGEVVDEIADRMVISRVAVEKGIEKNRTAAFALIRQRDPGNNQ